jgi:hypothetical protein
MRIMPASFDRIAIANGKGTEIGHGLYIVMLIDN